MNGLFIVFEFSTKNNDYASGIAKKIIREVDVLRNNGFKITLFNPYEDVIGTRKFAILRRLPFFGYFHKWVSPQIQYNSLDFIYIRKPWVMDVDTVLELRKIKQINPQIKIIMEVPTYPYDYEIRNLKDKTLLFKDKLYRHFLNGLVDRIATYSDDQEIFGIKTINISNGISLDEQLKNFEDENSKSIEIAAVSNLGFWHGYDRAITGLHNYYSNGGQELIHLHIVGSGEAESSLKELVRKYNLSDNVLFYGRKSKKDLDDIYRKCRIGFDSLGRHRSRVFYNSSLKSKEYLLKGLLVVSSVRNELDLFNYKYYLSLEANDNPIDFNKISNFYHEIYNNKYTEAEIRQEIIEFGSEHFNFNKVMLPIVNYVRGIEK